MRKIMQITGIVLMISMSGCGTPEDSGSSIEPGAESADSTAESNAHVNVDVGRALYFEGETPGSLVTVEPGTYTVERSGDSAIQLTSPDGSSIKFKAEQGVHEESIRGSLVLAEELGEDEAHIVILLEDGRSLDAVASYSGVVERGATITKNALSRQRVALARMRYPTQRPGQIRTQQSKHVSSSVSVEDPSTLRPAPQSKPVVQLGHRPQRSVPVITRVRAPKSASRGSKVFVVVKASDKHGLDGVTVSLGQEIYRYRAKGRRSVEFTAQLIAKGEGPTKLSVQAINTANRVSKAHRSTINVIGGRPRQPVDTAPADEDEEAAPPAQAAADLPASFDLRDRYPQHPEPKNQGSCGSCYIVSPVSVAEWAFAIDLQDRGVEGTPMALSAQAVMDCDEGSYGRDFGCTGGWPHEVYGYLEDHGVPLERDYPYTASEGACQPHEPYVWLTGSSYDYTPDPGDIKAAIHQGRPVTMIMDVYSDLYSYSGGVYQHETGSLHGKKSIVAIGWGSENGTDYWIIDNSSGTSWGVAGYCKTAVDDVSVRDTYAYYFSDIIVSDAATGP